MSEIFQYLKGKRILVMLVIIALLGMVVYLPRQNQRIIYLYAGVPVKPMRKEINWIE